MRRVGITITVLLAALVGSLSLLLVPGTFAADTHGLRGDYFADTSLAKVMLSRVDPIVNFNWATGAPAAGLATDNFAVRWSGQVVPRFSETYTFRIAADDGANSSAIALQAG